MKRGQIRGRFCCFPNNHKAEDDVPTLIDMSAQK